MPNPQCWSLGQCPCHQALGGSGGRFTSPVLFPLSGEQGHCAFVKWMLLDKMQLEVLRTYEVGVFLQEGERMRGQRQRNHS